jgi:antitoxin component of RelBE/YafQ-DinJ toxin-antitoxin module
MKSAIITLKTEPIIKAKAKKIAADLGFSLSAILNGYLVNFIRNKKINFGNRIDEPSEYLKEAIREVEEEKKGNYYSFNDPQKAVAFLDEVRKGNTKV